MSIELPVQSPCEICEGLAVQAIRATGRAGIRVGLAEVLFMTVPVIDTLVHVRAAGTTTHHRRSE